MLTVWCVLWTSISAAGAAFYFVLGSCWHLDKIVVPCLPIRCCWLTFVSRFIVFLQARQQVQEMVWMKQSENMVLEAMTRLSTVHDALEELLMGAMMRPQTAEINTPL